MSASPRCIRTAASHGVSPISSTASTLAPKERSNDTHSSRPLAAAACNAVPPHAFGKSTSYPRSSTSHAKTSACPFAAAQCAAVCPNPLERAWRSDSSSRNMSRSASASPDLAAANHRERLVGDPSESLNNGR